ncbi:MAG TPA: mechanosensitive ion channel domain-containing protein [Casimicrobiaceae bacterium]|jgi:small-conductance mechanosensitive channel
MLAPINFDQFEQALATPRGWLDFALVALCLGIAWLVDRRAMSARKAAAGTLRFNGSVARVVFPLTALVLTLIATVAFRRYAGPPFFLSIAAPLLIALATIRMLVYGLRRIFKTQGWLPTSERAIALAIFALVVLYFLGLFPEIANALEEIQIPLGKTRISLLSIGIAVLVVVFTLIVTLWISGLIEQHLSRATQVDANLRVVFGKFVRAVLLVVGVLIALQAIGFDLTLLSVFGGALGVGIGLGLQKLASNYIAGFTILMDRSIRLGDMVTVDGRYGMVSKVTSRYVVVRSLDGVEAIVPNETLVTTTVLNHSYSTRNVRLALQVQISYDSDVDRALALMEEIGRGHDRVLTAPDPPTSFLVSFGDNGIVLELGVWIADPEKGQLNLRSALNREILDAFRANGIRLPFPQRDVRIVTTPSSPAVASEPSANVASAALATVLKPGSKLAS